MAESHTEKALHNSSYMFRHTKTLKTHKTHKT